jgi:pyruvate/2-oxoglutarate dehydrogenase complex dihydrolipoamide acyltransferase (E2) component
MPQFGETPEEQITIVRWLKQPGEMVQAGEALLQIETDKATLEVEAADSGRLARIEKQAGEVVKPATIIAYLQD